MIDIKAPVDSVPKIGKQYKKLLEKLGIHSVEDLLYHFPFRYEDYSIKKTVNQLEENDTCTVQGVLGVVKNIYTKYGKRLTVASLIDYTGEINIVWFNQHYLKKSLKAGKTYNISGKVGFFSRKLHFISPTIEEKGKELNTAALVPVYPETAGLTSKWLRTRINDVLNRKTNLEEFLPENLIKKHDLEPLIPALNKIHFPKNILETERGVSRFQFEELFMELLNVEKRKYDWHQSTKSIPIKPHNEETQDFIKKLPWELTPEQKIAVEQIFRDLNKKIPMNRLLEGDVGTGKTIVAIITAYLTYLNGYKTLYMAPTEILANQHFETFKQFLPNLKTELNTSSTNIKEEKWDVLIGTHALLFAKEKYEDVAFIVIDEQHRFGVEQRGKIKNLVKGNKTPHVLTMTATPIPRTLALTIYGDLDISLLKTYPNKQRKITTKVVPEKLREQAYKWIKKQNEPAFIVCPLIEESEHTMLENVKAAEDEFKKLRDGVFKGVSMGLLHGRMKSKEKEEVVSMFKKGEIQILVSTPVIEVGIDIPEATIIVIESAERYGLASLHQLRGRVGRGDKEGFCFVFMSNNSKKSYRRLKNLELINEGMKLAELDLKIRGRGDIFGTRQHGFKDFKIADLSDLQMIQKAKTAAEKYHPKLEEYPKLSKKLTFRRGKHITNN